MPEVLPLSAVQRRLSKLAGRYLLRLALGQPVAPVLSDLADYVQTAVPRALIAMRPSG